MNSMINTFRRRKVCKFCENKVDSMTLGDELLEKEFGRQKIVEDLLDKHNLDEVGINNAKDSRTQLEKRKKKSFQDGVQVVREIREERE